jgi:septum formation inhibitor MinC
LIWLAAAETDACWRPEAEGFFDDGKGVGEVVDQVRIVAEEIRGGGGVRAQEGVVFFSEGVEDVGVFAEGSVCILAIVSGGGVEAAMDLRRECWLRCRDQRR